MKLKYMYNASTFHVDENLPYGGLPQNVSNFDPGVNSFENPKSAIFIFNSLSNKRFSAFKSLWNIFED